MKEHMEKAVYELSVALDIVMDEILFVSEEMNELLSLGMKTDDPEAVEKMSDDYAAMTHRYGQLKAVEEILFSIMILSKRVKI